VPGYGGVRNHLQILAKNNDLAEYLDKFAGAQAAVAGLIQTDSISAQGAFRTGKTLPAHLKSPPLDARP